jgi:hypothetical protein
MDFGTGKYSKVNERWIKKKPSERKIKKEKKTRSYDKLSFLEFSDIMEDPFSSFGKKYNN